MGDIVKKIMGPVMVGGGALSEYFFPGNPIGISAIGQGLGQSLGQGGFLSSLLGQNQNVGAPPPPTSRNVSMGGIGAPASPAIPSSAATGISTFIPGAGPSAGQGAGPQGADMSSYANMIASQMMTNNPFAIYGGQ